MPIVSAIQDVDAYKRSKYAFVIMSIWAHSSSKETSFLINVSKQNPRIAEHITCTTYPTISADVPAWTFNDFPSVFIPADAPNPEITKKFAAWLYRPDGYIRQMHATPGHVLPVLKTIAYD